MYRRRGVSATDSADIMEAELDIETPESGMTTASYSRDHYVITEEVAEMWKNRINHVYDNFNYDEVKTTLLVYLAKRF